MGVAGRIGKAYGQPPMTNDRGKSDRPIAPTKSPNKAGPQKQRGYGDPYTGTKAETLDTSKGPSYAPLQAVR